MGEKFYFYFSKVSKSTVSEKNLQGGKCRETPAIAFKRLLQYDIYPIQSS